MARRPSSPRRSIDELRGGRSAPSRDPNHGPAGLHRTRPVCVPAGEHAQEGLGVAPTPRSGRLAIGLVQWPLAPCPLPAPPRPEDRCSNTCLTRFLSSSPNTSLPIRCSDAGGHSDLSYKACCLPKLFLRGASMTDHDIDSYSPGTESYRAKRQIKARC